MEEAAARVDQGEFSAAVALIVGGSRGLGEVTAKLIAAGGGKVIITYASGAGDAGNLAAQINSWGGRCEVAAYDVWREAAGQLRVLSEAPTHVYYFATPSIVRRKAALCTRERLEEFNQFYIFGFRALVDAVRALRSGAITVFYPSSVYVAERGPELTEYAMAKAAGEILCADMTRYEDGVRILCHRLPRVLTDQTASMIPGQAADPCEVMLPLVRAMHG
jgi:NAD(P)-dependent dehydrogenase (short-subunit alcohol dehydrogenase family)